MYGKNNPFHLEWFSLEILVRYNWKIDCLRVCLVPSLEISWQKPVQELGKRVSNDVCMENLHRVLPGLHRLQNYNSHQCSWSHEIFLFVKIIFYINYPCLSAIEMSYLKSYIVNPILTLIYNNVTLIVTITSYLKNLSC